MLIPCPECDLQVSDKALACPHCGYPLKPEAKRTYTRKSNRRKRLPNGFGQISEIKGQNLRNRFRASVTVGKTNDGKFIRKLLKPKAYFSTYNDAYAALVEYNKNPYDLDSDITMKDLYEKWSEEYFKTLSKSSINTINAAWRYCSSIYGMRVSDVRARHLKGCMMDGYITNKDGEKKYPPASMRGRIKSTLNILLDYALEYELIEKNYARTFNVPKEIRKEVESGRQEHIVFSDDEIKTLWDNVDKIAYVDMLLIQCYTGWRPRELGLLRLENINLKNGIMVGGMKSTAGTNRVVPIHLKIKKLVERRYEEAKSLNSEYLFNINTDVKNNSKNDLFVTYDKYKHYFMRICDTLSLNPGHRPHDGRKHFITTAKRYNVDEYAIKYIVGHAITDITEKVYTERDIDWLKSEIAKIK